MSNCSHPPCPLVGGGGFWCSHITEILLLRFTILRYHWVFEILFWDSLHWDFEIHEICYEIHYTEILRFMRFATRFRDWRDMLLRFRDYVIIMWLSYVMIVLSYDVIKLLWYFATEISRLRDNYVIELSYYCDWVMLFRDFVILWYFATEILRFTWLLRFWLYLTDLDLITIP